ncbi:hypothetical protein TSMEX_003797 [Taenia solium]|eukprot:TsM_000692300 transcript=TsM_000692300 gene=TsM_000692300
MFVCIDNSPFTNMKLVQISRLKYKRKSHATSGFMRTKHKSKAFAGKSLRSTCCGVKGYLYNSNS